MKREVNESQFHMWRAVVSMVFSDGRKHEDEVKFLEEKFLKLPLTDSQKKTLMGDLKSPPNLDKMWAGIANPGDKSQFIYFARLLYP